MALDPRLQPLADLLVRVAARELIKKNAVGLGGQHDGVEEMRRDDCQATGADAQDVRALLQDL
jgi:D-alanyl-D-alanine dipeptidase